MKKQYKQEVAKYNEKLGVKPKDSDEEEEEKKKKDPTQVM